MSLPKVSSVRHDDTVRLIPSKYSEPEDSVLSALVATEADLNALAELDGLTDDRLLAEHQLLPGIGIHELLFDLPYARIVNAAYTHAHPQGSRFNGPDRGAWYAAFEIETAQAEVAFHKSVELAEVNHFEQDLTFDAYLADFNGELHDIRGVNSFRSSLTPESYVVSQQLAQRLLEAQSLGIIYSSVRRPAGTCLACFRPAVVTNVRKCSTCRFVRNGAPAPQITVDFHLPE